MCGIIGYVGKNNAQEILVEGLRRLEYRGYDSSGFTVINQENKFKTIKSTGHVNKLSEKLTKRLKSNEKIGIAHTRWATHGEVTENNAHPHISCDKKFSIVHNGVIENYLSIKKFLVKKNFFFQSDTDTEVLVNLIAYHYIKEKKDANRFLSSVRKSLKHIDGTYGIAVMCIDFPNDLIGARKGSPLIIGIGKQENILASDVSALIRHTQNVVYLNDNELVHMKKNKFSIITNEKLDVDIIIEKIDWKIEESELKNYKHFMEKEIFEQPIALENAMRGRFSDDLSTAKFGGLNLIPQQLRQIDRILFCGCGTAWHSCLVAEYLIEQYARIPVEVEYASEFRYRNAPLKKDSLISVISQSGETIDTLAALREAKRKGFKTMALVNVVGSTIAREADGGIYQHAGPEIGVASTKAFTSQLLIAAMLALYFGRMHDMSFQNGKIFVQALKKIPEQVSSILSKADLIQEIASRYVNSQDFMFLGRQAMFPIALEGALKLKEISYIHAEGYPAAEMKHGPIALISEKCPSIFLATQKEVFEKVISNIQEVRARKGKVIVITNENSRFPKNLANDCILIPDAHEAVQPILATIPLQLLSYYIAIEKGCDVDKPRNLAKSVTVE